ncbi:MAG: hypothetical protein J6M53_06025 [Bacteroidaceae bacterium]|nr:hypothetical protein [Bacteroidaceae bacterium]
MKKFDFRGLLSTVCTMLLMTTMAFSFTACGDDDDNKDDKKPLDPNASNYVTINGTKHTIDAVDVTYFEFFDGYTIEFYEAADGEEDLIKIASVDIDPTHLGKTYSLTQDLSGDPWYTGIIFPGINYYGYWTDEKAFQSGTLYVNIGDETVRVKVSGKTNKFVGDDGDEHPAVDFAIDYDGAYYYYIGEIEDEGGEVEEPVEEEVWEEEAATRPFFSVPARKNHKFIVRR